MPSFDLGGRTALVTGAARGLGRAIALALANAGADVALGFRDAAADAGLAAEIGPWAGWRCRSRWTRSSSDEAYAAIDKAIAELGRIDILVNNVGGGVEAWAEDMTEADFDLTIDLNVKSTFFISQRVMKHMKEAGGGRIINMASQAGFIALPTELVYCLSKAAVVHMTKCLAVEWGKYGINVNAVAPTFIETPGTTPALSKPEFHAEVIERIAALHRIGKPIEVSGAVVFLASPAASLITGHTIVIDGGWTAR